jgi:hypothetical protein
MKHYYRIMLGKGSCLTPRCHKHNFIGVTFELELTNEQNVS